MLPFAVARKRAWSERSPGVGKAKNGASGGTGCGYSPVAVFEAGAITRLPGWLTLGLGAKASNLRGTMPRLPDTVAPLSSLRLHPVDLSFPAVPARNTPATTQFRRPQNESMGFDAISHSLCRNQINSEPNWVPCHRRRVFRSLAWAGDDTDNDPGASG